MAQDNTISQPVKDFSSLVLDNLKIITIGLSKILSSAYKSAFGYALAGLAIAGIYYIIAYHVETGGEGSQPESIIGWLSLFYLVVAGILCGAAVGFTLGLKKGVKKALLNNDDTYRLFETILGACFEQIDRVGADSNPVAELKKQFDKWSRKIREIDRVNFSPDSKRVIARLKGRLEGVFVNRLAGALETVNDEIEMYKLDYSEREEAVKNLARRCREKTDAALDKSINRVFLKPLFFAHAAASVFLVLPALILLFF